MDNGKIQISLDEVNNAQIDEEIRRQDIASRMALHQAQVEANQSVAASQATGGGFFRNTIVYMTLFGLVSAVIGWFVSEPFFIDAIEDGDDFMVCLWSITMAVAIGVGLAIAEPIVGHNWLSALGRGLLGAILGIFAGIIGLLAGNILYVMLGGEPGCFSFGQVFARGIGWGILGMILASAPGIAMRNRQKFKLCRRGGAIGGFVGGLLFDVIALVTGNDGSARFIGIVGLGVGAAVATALLEESAKQGWLKVATGVITGKQFILYRNPTVIGSSPKSEIFLFKDPTVAPKHAAINRIGDDFLVTALNGAPVLVNGAPVREKRLENGDQIRVGNTVFLFASKAAKRA